MPRRSMPRRGTRSATVAHDDHEMLLIGQHTCELPLTYMHLYTSTIPKNHFCTPIASVVILWLFCAGNHADYPCPLAAPRCVGGDGCAEPTREGCEVCAEEVSGACAIKTCIACGEHCSFPEQEDCQYDHISIVSITPWLIVSRIRRQRLCVARGGLQYRGVLCWYPPNLQQER